MLGNNYINAQNKELADLNELYSSMMIATNDGSYITVSVEDLNKIIDAKLKEKKNWTLIGTSTITTISNSTYESLSKAGYNEILLIGVWLNGDRCSSCLIPMSMLKMNLATSYYIGG